MKPLQLRAYRRIVVFTGAGMSAESGVPTYRGRGGIWNQYRYEDYACERAFRKNADAVLDFHEVRRQKVLECQPHAGHRHLSALQRAHPGLKVITQNVDGMHQRSGTQVAAELHGSLWRVRCEEHGITEDTTAASYAARRCPHCGAALRPDITWFEDPVNLQVFAEGERLIGSCDLFISVGTSAVVYPAASLIPFGREQRPRLVEINTEETEASAMFDESWRVPASALPGVLT